MARRRATVPQVVGRSPPPPTRRLPPPPPPTPAAAAAAPAVDSAATPAADDGVVAAAPASAAPASAAPAQYEVDPSWTAVLVANFGGARELAQPCHLGANRVEPPCTPLQNPAEPAGYGRARAAHAVALKHLGAQRGGTTVLDVENKALRVLHAGARAERAAASASVSGTSASTRTGRRAAR